VSACVGRPKQAVADVSFRATQRLAASVGRAIILWIAPDKKEEFLLRNPGWDVFGHEDSQQHHRRGPGRLSRTNRDYMLVSGHAGFGYGCHLATALLTADHGVDGPVLQGRASRRGDLRFQWSHGQS